MPKLDIFARGQGLQHPPLLEQLPLDQLDPSQDLETGVERVTAHMIAGGPQFMQNEFEPEFRGLMLDDEQQLIVMGWITQRALGAQQLVEAQIARIDQAVLEIQVYACFQFTVTVAFGGYHKLIIARHPLFPLLEISIEKMGESVFVIIRHPTEEKNVLFSSSST